MLHLLKQSVSLWIDLVLDWCDWRAAEAILLRLHSLAFLFSDQENFLIFFKNGRIGSSYMTESNSIELFNVGFFWLRNRPPKLKYHFFRGSFPQPTSKSKLVGEPD